MRLKIERVFKDKFTGEAYSPGDVREFEDDRAKELLSDSRKLVTLIKETTEETPEEAPKKSIKKSKK